MSCHSSKEKFFEKKEKKEREIKSSPNPFRWIQLSDDLEIGVLGVCGHGCPLSIPPSPVSSCSRIIDHGDGSPPLNTIFWSPWRRLVRRREGLKHDSGWKVRIRVKSRISPLWERGRGKAPDPRDGHVDGLKSVQLVWTYSVNVRPFWPEALSGKRERAPL